MEEKFVTLAIHSFEKAQILKTILENHGIDVYLHNVNLIQPVISAGVRVRIKESDLPFALRIVENTQSIVEEGPAEDFQSNKILVPVDFSSHSYQACRVAFQYAQKHQLEVDILHIYYTPFLTNPMAIGDVMGYDLSENDLLRDATCRVNDNLMAFKNQLQAQMEKKEIPYVKFEMILREGVAEEEIIRYAKEVNPRMIIMGTRGKSQKDLDIIGSVTAEVIDRTRIPLFAIPDQMDSLQIDHIRNLAFLTNFEERDLISFDGLTQFIKDIPCNVYFFHLSEQGDDKWGEIKLEGIKQYFGKQYPEKKIHCELIEGEDSLLMLEQYIQKYQIDVLALTNKRRNIFARLFNPSMARRMLFHNDTPLLVFP